MLEQREIVLIPVPFTDLRAIKRRPVLILSSNQFNAKSQDVLVAAITSNLEGTREGRIIRGDDLDSGLLPRTSLVRADKIYTLSQDIVVKRFGKLGREPFDEVLSILDSVLGRTNRD